MICQCCWHGNMVVSAGEDELDTASSMKLVTTILRWKTSMPPETRQMLGNLRADNAQKVVAIQSASSQL